MTHSFTANNAGGYHADSKVLGILGSAENVIHDILLTDFCDNVDDDILLSCLEPTPIRPDMIPSAGNKHDFNFFEPFPYHEPLEMICLSYNMTLDCDEFLTLLTQCILMGHNSHNAMMQPPPTK